MSCRAPGDGAQARQGQGAASRAREIDETGEYPDDIFAAFRDADLLGLCMPRRVRRLGSRHPRVDASPSRRSRSTRAPAALMLLLTRLADRADHDRRIRGSRKQRYLPGIADGTQRAGFRPCRRPGAGSDVVGMRTRATADPEQTRRMGAERREVLDVRGRPGGLVHGVRQDRRSDEPAARLDHRLRRRASVRGRLGRLDRRKMGVRGVDTGELVLSDVRVPAENVIGEVGGFRLAMLGLNSMRPIVAARGIGLAEGALMYAVEYVKQRRPSEARSPTSRASSGRSPSSPSRSRRPGSRPTGRLGSPTRAGSTGSGCRTCRWPSTTRPRSR